MPEKHPIFWRIPFNERVKNYEFLGNIGTDPKCSRQNWTLPVGSSNINWHLMEATRDLLGFGPKSSVIYIGF